MGALGIILQIVHLLICVGLIAVVLLQTGKDAGLGAIGGGSGSSDTFFGKNRKHTVEAMLKRCTAVGAFLFLATSVLLYLFINR